MGRGGRGRRERREGGGRLGVVKGRDGGKATRKWNLRLKRVSHLASADEPLYNGERKLTLFNEDDTFNLSSFGPGAELTAVAVVEITFWLPPGIYNWRLQSNLGPNSHLSIYTCHHSKTVRIFCPEGWLIPSRLQLWEKCCIRQVSQNWGRVSHRVTNNCQQRVLPLQATFSPYRWNSIQCLEFC